MIVSVTGADQVAVLMSFQPDTSRVLGAAL
jgi:hypothetical protein